MFERMEVHLNNPELQAQIDRWVTETGRKPDELIEDAVAAYFAELAQRQQILNRRYDDLKSGRVQPIDGEEAYKRLMAKTDAQRHRPE